MITSYSSYETEELIRMAEHKHLEQNITDSLEVELVLRLTDLLNTDEELSNCEDRLGDAEFNLEAARAEIEDLKNENGGLRAEIEHLEDALRAYEPLDVA